MSDLVLGGPDVLDDPDREKQRSGGKNRRTLTDIAYYPEPDEIYRTLINSEGWEYKTRQSFYLTRDRAMVSLLYLLAVRVSEVLRLKRDQFIMPYEEGGRKDSVVVRAIYLSKRRYKDKPRLDQYRDEGFLPLGGPRKPLTMLVINYLQLMDRDAEERRRRDKRPRKRAGTLFKFNESRAYQITMALTGATNHWFRAFGETYLYENQFDYDLLGTADYVKVDPGTLGKYIRRGYRRHIKKKGVV